MRQRVGVFIVNSGTVLLIHRIKNGEEYYAVPGGGMEPGEAEQETATREIKEETGLDVVLSKKLGTLELDGETQYFYIAESFRGALELGGPEKERQSPDNSYRLEWVPVNTLGQIALRDEVKALLLKIAAVEEKTSLS